MISLRKIIGIAPEFEDIKGWINSKKLSVAGLKGKVVLLDFWTYSCVNCIRTLPHMKKIWEKYKEKDFVLIGMHTPEFDFERKRAHVEKAVKKQGIEYPVALDSDNVTWKLYGNVYWPRQTLIKGGKIVYEHVGEGGYAEIEQNIIDALELKGKTEKVKTRSPTSLLKARGPPSIGSDHITIDSPPILSLIILTSRIVVSL